jgi:predicted DNA-binding ribbon-helix-helix protein
MPTMAKKKPSKAEEVMITRGLRMSGTYSKWLERFARKERMNIASLIDRAMEAHAEKEGFDPPPERIP